MPGKVVAAPCLVTKPRQHVSGPLNCQVILSSPKATLPWFPGGGNFVQIQIYSRQNLNGERSNEDALIHRPMASHLFEDAARVKKARRSGPISINNSCGKRQTESYNDGLMNLSNYI